MKKKLFFFLPFVLFILITFLLFFYQREQHQFTFLCDTIFQNEMTSDTLTMHYSVANPCNFRIYSYEPILPVYKNETLSAQVSLENLLSALEHINPNKLRPADRKLHMLLTPYLNLRFQLGRFPYYEEPLSPSGGMQTELPLLLAEYTFRTRQDVTDYLALLNQYDEYLAGLTEFEKEKAEHGLFMADYSVDKLITQCDTLFDKNLLESEEHFLQKTFADRTSALVSEQIISEKEKEQFDADNTRLLQTVVAPAYERLGDELYLLKGSGINECGLAHFPDGKNYYSLYFQTQTGSVKPLDTWKTLLYEDLEETYLQLSSLVSAHPEIQKFFANEPAFPLSNAREMLSRLEQMALTDFPALSGNVTCRIEEVSPSLSPFTAPAFYLTPPIDDTASNVIYLNPEANNTPVELFTTLAHEGFPGHLYQSVYSTNYFIKEEQLPLRHILWYGGYCEGWALYVELLSYDYAAKLFDAPTSASVSHYYEALKLNRRLQLSLFSLLDIMVHYDGATEEEITTILSNFGLGSGSSGRAVYEYLVEVPANYCKYYVGYLEILELKEDYHATFPAKTDKDFHQFYLSCGPSDFNTLHTLLEESATEK